jgi:hypothetical protein
MTFVCLWSPHWRTGAVLTAPEAPPAPDLVRLAATLLTRAPRVHVHCAPSEPRDGEDTRGLIWADARGLDARALARDLLELARDDGLTDVSAGVASTPVAAELAAMRGEGDVHVIDAGRDREFVALFPLETLEPPQRLRPLLFGIGISTCGALAELTRESVEVRLGADAVTLWRRARADDDRAQTLFAPMPRELPHATLDWMDYEVTDPARLLFVINALLERVCDALGEDGLGAREMSLEFSLANRTAHVEPLRASRPTANRHSWVRMVRLVLDRMSLPAAVTGIALRASRVAGIEDRQGDLFDKGFVTAAEME